MPHFAIIDLKNINQPKTAVSREDLLNRADFYEVHRWSDGYIDEIRAYQKTVLIHRTVANYQPDITDHVVKLQDVTGFLVPEVMNDYQEDVKQSQLKLLDTGVFIQIEALALTNAQTILYTVPKNKNFYLSMYDLDVEGAISDEGSLFYEDPLGNIFDVAEIFFPNVANHAHTQNAFNGFKLTSGYQIGVFSSTTAVVSVNVKGVTI